MSGKEEKDAQKPSIPELSQKGEADNDATASNTPEHSANKYKLKKPEFYPREQLTRTPFGYKLPPELENDATYGKVPFENEPVARQDVTPLAEEVDKKRSHVPPPKAATTFQSQATDSNQKNHIASLLISVSVILFLLCILSVVIAAIIYLLRADTKPAPQIDPLAPGPLVTESIAPAKPSFTHSGELKEIREALHGKETPGKEAIVVAKINRVLMPENPLDLTLDVTEFLQNIRVGGMRSGPNPRVMINEVTYQRGDIVDSRLGLQFLDINDGKIIFKDPNRVLYKKSF